MEANLHWSKKTMTDFAEIETVLLHLRKKSENPKALIRVSKR